MAYGRRYSKRSFRGRRGYGGRRYYKRGRRRVALTSRIKKARYVPIGYRL